jgi:hypothetical protein
MRPSARGNDAIDVDSIIVPELTERRPLGQPAAAPASPSGTDERADVSEIVRPLEKPPSHLDRARVWIAGSLVALLCLEVLVALIVAAVDPASGEAILRVLDKVFTPTVGLVSAAVAFYYARPHG